MKVSHAAAAVDVAFDDPKLIADAGLVPVLALAEQIDLPALICEHVVITGAANGGGWTRSRTWTGCGTPGNGVVFDQIRAPSTLRAFTHGHMQQLNAVLRQSLIALAKRTPVLPGAEEVVSWTWAPPTAKSMATPSRAPRWAG